MEQDKYNTSNSRVLLELANTHMPYGKYKGCLLCDLPEPYLVWFSRNGFPSGKLGFLLSSIYEIKVNGLEYLLKPLRDKKPQI
ncbi:MAG: DUF3820 family protein [Dehalococcoidales bacterium]|jgi:uncharacterized protein (DUF3820 family)|nr:DUF3820 family protein [Dehalococcoidales bacterium]MDD5604509.1 DUF3820 family protein [Dehalococcoidales bacterium]NLE90599.1 DUF3820 family protein [Dehalococcoidales bacterium]